MEKKKRIRAANFTAEEIRLLIRLALKEKHVLENKQTDSEVWKQKTKTWEKIANIFNASSGQIFRSVETLKLKYEGLKKELKKKVNKNKVETLKTGGGNPNYVIIDGPEKELLEVLSLSVHGLPSTFDSDSVLPHTTITGEKDIEVVKNIQTITDEEIELYKLPMVMELTDLSRSENVVKVMEGTNVYCSEDVAEGSSNNQTIPEFQSASESVVKNIEDINPQKKATGAWKTWSPGSLKSKKHPLLTPGKKKEEDRNKKLNKLLELREELVKQQIHHVQQEERRAQEKHEKEMKLLDLEIIMKEKKL